MRLIRLAKSLSAQESSYSNLMSTRMPALFFFFRFPFDLECSYKVPVIYIQLSRHRLSFLRFSLHMQVDVIAAAPCLSMFL
jgi:membrane protease subunit (stomatin/prohibitin family)